MITLAWYFLKVIICSGILCGYYFLALRNKAFHRWNRFYILASVVISLLVPIMKINFFPKAEEKGTVVQMLQTISYGDEAVVEYSRNNSFQLTTQNLTEGFYLLISLIFFFIFLLSLYKITRLKKKFPAKEFEGISFINTSAKGTPFSFFKSIFWNKAIDLHSKPGQQIFNHEIAHIKEKHSYDKIFMNIVLIFFWINPFFWLMQKELFMIHEFIADKEAVEDSDINSFAEMVLQTVYPGQNFSLANNFFYSPLKRRLLMLTKNKNPKANYISRLLVLPLAAIVFFAFTLKVKNKTTNFYHGKRITVIIDAGHGGSDNGAISNDGVKEKDITLSIAKKVAELNSNPQLEILLPRKDDYSLSVKDRVEFAKSNNADLFISIHVNSSSDQQLNGFSVLIDKNKTQQNLLLGSAIINQLKESYKTEEQIGTRTNSVWVLDNNVCTAALVECGYLSNLSDAAFITNSANQDKIAKNILDAINVYASSEENGKTAISVVNSDSIPNPRDSIPFPIYYKGKKLKYTQYVDNDKNVEATYYDGSKETITKEEAKKRGFIPPPPPPLPRIPGHGVFVDARDKVIIPYDKLVNTTFPEKTKVNLMKAVIVINGEIEPNSILKTKTIHAGTLTIHSGDEKDLIAKYGEKATNGVFILDNASIKNEKPVYPEGGKPSGGSGIVFTKVEVEASFPGGPHAWSKYVSKAIQDSIGKFTKADYGTCVIRFIVNVDGSISDIVATTMQGTELAKVSIKAIEKGPKWIPASQNGHTVAAYRLQPVTLSNGDQKTPSKNSESFKNPEPVNATNSNQQVFTKLQKLASFPGGQSSWLKYISRAIQKNGNELIADKNSRGICKVEFVVSRDGNVSDVQAVSRQGTKLADVAINTIKNGPRWIPGMQNGHTVNSLVIQPVSFALSDKLILKEPE